MKKVLFVATVDQHIRHFHIPYLKWFKEKGFQVSVASHGNEGVPYVDLKYEIPFDRKPWALSNILALIKLLKILCINQYEIIHTHTPVASILIRVANFITGNKSKIIYTAHGFHFYKGAKILNWLVYFPVEKALSFCTDTIITINDEDFNVALRKGFGSKRKYLVDGVGVDLNKFYPPTAHEKDTLRDKFGLNKNDFILIYVAELSKRKNQELLLNVVSKLSDRIENLKLLLVGKGNEEERLRKQCSLLGIDDKVTFLGYRNDIADLMKASDLSVSTALQEGLPVNIMESLSTGLPCVVSNCRGNRDIISDNYNGFVVKNYDHTEFSSEIHRVFVDRKLFEEIKFNTVRSVEKFSQKAILEVMNDIYSECIGSKDE